MQESSAQRVFKPPLSVSATRSVETLKTLWATTPPSWLDTTKLPLRWVGTQIQFGGTHMKLKMCLFVTFSYSALLDREELVGHGVGGGGVHPHEDGRGCLRHCQSRHVSYLGHLNVD